MYIKISNEEILISENLKVHKFRKDNLDFITVELNHVDKLTLIKEMEITLDNKYYYLLDFKEEQISFNPERFNYEINLVEPTIKLQNIILPSRSITRRQTNPKTVIQVIEEYVEMYASNLSISNHIYSLFNLEVANEMVWEKPTLYKVLNDIISGHVNGYIRMSNHDEIDIQLLDNIGNEITNYSKIERVSDYENYANKINYELTDARVTDEDYIIELKQFKTYNGPTLQDNNFSLKLDYPVDEILSMTAYAVAVNAVDNIAASSYIQMSLIDNIVPKNVYDTLLPSISPTVVTDLSYKRSNVYFTKGSDEIGGWNYTDDSWVPVVTLDLQTWRNIFKSKNSLPAGQVYKPDKVFIEVIYKPIIKETNINLIKEASISNKTVQSGQSEKSVGIDLFGRQQRSMINSIGEDEVKIYGTGQPPELMDYIDNNYVSELQINYSSTGADWMAVAQKNYGELNLNTAIAYERRYTERVGLEENVISNHIVEYNYEFVDDRETDIIDNLAYNMLDNFIDKFNGIDKYRNLYYMYFTTIGFKSYVKQALSFSVDNSWVFKFQAKDNYSVGVGYKEETYLDESGEFPIIKRRASNVLNEVSYVDNNGEFQSIKVELLNGIYNEDIIINGLFNEESEFRLKSTPLVVRPAVIEGGTGYIGKYTQQRYKDDREITAETLQFNFVNNDNFMFYEEAFNIANLNDANNSNYEVYVNYDLPNYRYNLHGRKVGTLVNDIVVEFTTPTIRLIFDDYNRYFYGWIVYNKLTDKPVFSYNGDMKKVTAIKARTSLSEFIVDDYRVRVNLLMNINVTDTSVLNTIDSVSFSDTFIIEMENFEIEYVEYLKANLNISVTDTSVIVSYGSETFSDIIGVAISDYEIEYIEYIKLDLAVVINDMSIINTTNSKVFSDYIFVNSNLSVELYEYATITPNITIQDTSVITNISSVILSDNIYVGASIDRTLVLPIEPIVSVSISIENTYDDDVVNIAITQSSATQLTYAYIVATSQGGTKNGSGIATNGLSNEYVRYNPYGDVQAYVYVTFPAQVVDGYYYKAKTIYAET